ncbi:MULTISPECIES: sulfatase-like hydrolase/transferase [Mesorhizobium]|nr:MULTISPECIES: sulfatase-like hydrolase/transferase [Mesorhizobium]
MPEDVIGATEPYVWESEADGTLKKARPYTPEYRHEVEGDIAEASVEFIERASKTTQPFFLYVGWTHTHYPTLPAQEFQGKSRIGAYGDAVMELDFRTGQVLDAIKAAGNEDNTIVIWVSATRRLRQPARSTRATASTAPSAASSATRWKGRSARWA